MLLRSVVVTGGNTGLGYACAAELLASTQGAPWHVILACRDAQRASAAVMRLSRSVGAAQRVETMSLDLASLASVRAFATDLTSKLKAGAVPPLHGLVCNAGIQAGSKKLLTADGFEATFGVNHLGHFLLVQSLLPCLKAPARIVVVASGVHDPAQKWGLPAPAWNNPFALARGELGDGAATRKSLARGQQLYTTSKLANVYFTYALARRLPAGVTANAFDPGMMRGTGFLRENPAFIRFMGNYVVPRILGLFRGNIHTAEDSGASLAQLVIDPSLAEISGKYFEERREVPSSVESYDEARADALWLSSERLTA